MGLEVAIFMDAETYTCPCLKKRREIVGYWHQDHTCMVSNLDEVDSSSISKYKKTTFDYYDAHDCENECNSRGEGENLKTIAIEGVSHYSHDGCFLPGQVIKYRGSESFYFGGVGTTMRVWLQVKNYCMKNDLPNPMADMDCSAGYYSGTFLYWLKKQLGGIYHLDEKLKQYKDLLDEVPDKDCLMANTVVVHY